jgi:YegS/Rv2252/BmrU family lipid kinase
LNRKHILFVINPISGGKDKSHLPEYYVQNLDKFIYKPEIFWWDKVDDLLSRVSRFIEEDGWAVVAVGGDGTVNLTAQAVKYSGVLLAIIPLGSGNGFARQLGIPESSKAVIDMLNTQDLHQEKVVDMGKTNNGSFINIAGIGFDASVAHNFAALKKRGVVGYIISILKLYWKSKNETIDVIVDSQTQSLSGFMLNVANGTQWGNNFYIAPKAFLDDGQLDLVVVRKPRIHQILRFVLSLKNQKPHHLITYLRGKSIQIKLPIEMPMHLDGEPAGITKELEIKVDTEAVKILCSKKWRSQPRTD